MQRKDAVLPSSSPSLGCCYPKARRAQMLSTAVCGLFGAQLVQEHWLSCSLGQWESSSPAGAKLM